MSARQNSDHTAGWLIGGFDLTAVPMEPDQNLVAVHGHAGVLPGDIDIAGRRQFWNDEGKAFFAD